MSGTINSINPDRTDEKTIIDLPNPVMDIDIDVKKDRIFWLEYTGSQYQIKRSGIDGSGVTVVHYNSTPDAGPTSISIDNSSGTILWNEYKNASTNNDIWKSGNAADTLLPVKWINDIPVDYIYSTCADSINRKIYFTVNSFWNNGVFLGSGNSGSVYIADLDNINAYQQKLTGTGMSNPSAAFKGIAADGAKGYVYYVRNTTSLDIMRADLSLGSSIVWIPGSGLDFQKLALDLKHRKIYWTSKGDSSLYRADLDIPNSNVEKFLDLSGIPTGIAIFQ
jgi:hypothetical protein